MGTSSGRAYFEAVRTRAATVASLATSLLLTVGVVVAPQALAAGSADLSAAMNGDDGANVGEGTPFTLEVDNAGPDDTDATATYSVSGAGATIDAASVNGAVCASLSSCAVHVPAFDEVDITLTVTAHTTGDFTVSGSVTGVADDPSPDDNASSTTATAVTARPTQWQAPTSTRDVGDDALVTSTLRYTDDGTPVSGAPVTLFRRAAGSTGAWEDVTEDTTDDSGVAALDDSSGGLAWEYELVSVSTPGTAGATSGTTRPASAPLSVALSGPVDVVAGQEATFTGKVTYADGSVPGAVLISLLRKQADDAGFTVVTTTTDIGDDGSLAGLGNVPTHNATYVVEASSNWGTGRSAEVAVGVKPVPKLSVSPVLLPIGGQSTYTVRIPDGTGPVHFQRYVNGAWTTVATQTLDAAHTARFVFTTHAYGTTQVRAVRDADAILEGATTTGQSVTTVRAGPGRASDYAFMRTWNGKPIRWNPCHVITYRVNLKYAPANVMPDVREALRRITLATGLHFRYLGKTSWLPRADYKGWPGTSNTVIAWSPRDPMMPSFQWDSFTAGRGGPNTGRYVGKPWWREGWADFNSHDNASFPAGFGKNSRGALLMHELGHMIGLNHAKSGLEIMYGGGGWTSPAAVYGAGDMRGLHLLGRSQGC